MSPYNHRDPPSRAKFLISPLGRAREFSAPADSAGL